MFIFVSYALSRNKYLEIQKNLNDAIAEKENLFSRTQPKSPKWDKMPSSGDKNAFDSYLIAKEKSKIDERIKEMQKILDERRSFLKIKEQDLYESKELYDKAYRMKYLETKSVPELVRNLHSSRTQVYRILKFIKNEIEMADSTFQDHILSWNQNPLKNAF